MKRIVRVLEVLFLVAMIVLCVVVFMAGNGKVPYIFGYRILQVISNSMNPTIDDETCIVIKKVEQEDIVVGDIVTFVSEAPEIRGYLNTHRVHEITADEETGETLYITKGDAYELPDSYPVKYEQIAGRYVGELPLGELLFKGIRFLSDRNNYFVIIILPLFFCFASYAKDLMNALFKKEKDKTDDS
ncbi:MAG: signal peptidase I [Lachnospiraceae bacterium]|nr:signal peptidase I [Lachnospiraceae bacterium]